MSNKLTVYRGDDKDWTLTFTRNNSAIDITGYTIYLKVRKEEDKEKSDNYDKISKEVTNHSDPTNGITILSVSSADTLLPYGDYKYSLGLVTTANKVNTVLYDDFEVKDNIIR